jgi:deoxyribodipyrimidine photo-lyase
VNYKKPNLHCPQNAHVRTFKHELMSSPVTAVFWFRRDLRLDDNAGLYTALKESEAVLPLFIFDTHILDKLEVKEDRRVHFIHQCIQRLDQKLSDHQSSLKVLHGTALDSFRSLLRDHPKLLAVYCNCDYEPSAIKRDEEIKEFLNENNIEFKSFKDQCIFHVDDVLKKDGTPYTIFTPYSRIWKAQLKEVDYRPFDTRSLLHHFARIKNTPIPSLNDLGFKATSIKLIAPKLEDSTLRSYKGARDFPAQEGTTRLSVHLRFGTVGIRRLVARTLPHSETWLNELIWREFYKMILWHFPHVVNAPFKKEYAGIKWINNEQQFKAWCEGKTGFPIVDAGMRELNATGFMHNRVRMIVSSFLVKDLLIDWRWGEAYFAEKLDDFDLSSNNGGWQWAAGCGCDAAPYFRVFNPAAQQKKFDPDLEYIKRWIPEWGTDSYPPPIVDHTKARARALETYKKALSDFRG